MNGCLAFFCAPIQSQINQKELDGLSRKIEGFEDYATDLRKEIAQCTTKFSVVARTNQTEALKLLREKKEKQAELAKIELQIGAAKRSIRKIKASEQDGEFIQILTNVAKIERAKMKRFSSKKNQDAMDDVRGLMEEAAVIEEDIQHEFERYAEITQVKISDDDLKAELDQYINNINSQEPVQQNNEQTAVEQHLDRALRTTQAEVRQRQPAAN
jgi:hypothetical protein